MGSDRLRRAVVGSDLERGMGPIHVRRMDQDRHKFPIQESIG
jgi:hypothetical protein